MNNPEKITDSYRGSGVVIFFLSLMVQKHQLTQFRV